MKWEYYNSDCGKYCMLKVGEAVSQSSKSVITVQIKNNIDMILFTSSDTSMKTEGERQTGVVNSRVSLFFELAFFYYFLACLSKPSANGLIKSNSSAPHAQQYKPS